MDRLDETDERILAELAEHARATFAEIGQRVNLSAPAVKRRVDRLLDNGVIRGFTTVSTAMRSAGTPRPMCRFSATAPSRPMTPRGLGGHSGGGQRGDGHRYRRTRSCTCWPAICGISKRRWNASAPAADIERSESIVVLSNIIERALCRERRSNRRVTYIRPARIV